MRPDHQQQRIAFETYSGRSALTAGTALHARGCAKTPAFILRVESPSRFRQSENQKCWWRLSAEGNKENESPHSWLAHVFTQPGPFAVIRRSTPIGSCAWFADLASSHLEVENAPLMRGGA
jgi:hypothetical protein